MTAPTRDDVARVASRRAARAVALHGADRHVEDSPVCWHCRQARELLDALGLVDEAGGFTPIDFDVDEVVDLQLPGHVLPKRAREAFDDRKRSPLAQAPPGLRDYVPTGPEPSAPLVHRDDGTA